MRKQPSYRFVGFEDEWKEVKVSDIFRVTRGQVLATTEISEEKTDTHKYPVYSSQTKNEGLLGYYDKYLFETAITWTTDGANAGTVNYREGKFYSTNVNGVLLSDEGFANKVIAEILNKEAWKYVSKVGNPKLMNNVMSEISLVIPNDFREISILSTFFQDTDQLISLQLRKLEVLKEQKKTYLKLLFPAKGQTKPALRFAGFEDEWKEVKVSDIFRVTRGQVLATTEISEEKTDTHKYPVYSSQTKNEGLLGYYDKYLFETAITWTTDGANAGTVNYREGKFYSTNVNGVLLSDEGFANKVIAEILNKEAWKYVSKVGNPKLMNNVMSEISLVIPNDFREISILSTFFQDLDKSIAKQEEKVNQLKESKQTLLRKMFI